MRKKITYIFELLLKKEMFSTEEAYSQAIDCRIAKGKFHREYEWNEDLIKDVRWLEQHHYQVYVIECGKGFLHIYTQLDELFFFPNYAHKNLNSLNDVLVDIQIHGKGLVLVLKNIEENHPLTNCLISIAFEQFLVGKRLFILSKSKV